MLSYFYLFSFWIVLVFRWERWEMDEKTLRSVKAALRACWFVWTRTNAPCLHVRWTARFGGMVLHWAAAPSSVVVLLVSPHSNLTWLDFPLLWCATICGVLFCVVQSIIRLVLPAVLFSDYYFFFNPLRFLYRMVQCKWFDCAF